MIPPILIEIGTNLTVIAPEPSGSEPIFVVIALRLVVIDLKSIEIETASTVILPGTFHTEPIFAVTAQGCLSGRVNRPRLSPTHEGVVLNPKAPGFVFPRLGVINSHARPGSNL